MVALTMKLTSADSAIHNIQAGSVLFFGLLESKNSKHELLRLSLGGAGDCFHVWLWARISAQASSFLWIHAGGPLLTPPARDGRTDGRAEGRRGRQLSAK